MLNGHKVIYEIRSKPCCDMHTATVAVCECGWESNINSTDPSIDALYHRLTELERVVNVLCVRVDSGG